MILRIFLLAVLICATGAASSVANDLSKQWNVTFDERIRLETWDNAITLDETAEAPMTYTRTRTRLGAVWSPSSHAAIGLRLANEFRYFLAPTSVDFSLHEVFVDHLYARLTLSPALPLTFTIGRQDIMLGEGFIVLDGTPLDGSRSAYFNTVRIDWTFPSDHNVTAFASHQKETNAWLPVIHEANQELIEQPETGLGLYYRGKWSQRDVHLYLVYLNRSDNPDFPLNSTVTTLGGRIQQRIVKSTDLTAVIETGFQFGERANASRRAWGGHGYLKYRPEWRSKYSFLPASLTAGLIYLSGDNPGTDTWEGWDPMFGRWPKWSESYIYTQIKEDAVAWWTNLVSVNLAAQFYLTQSAELTFTVHHLVAPQESEISSDFPGGGGNTRGKLFIGELSYAFDRCWSGHLLAEHFDPGDYYLDDASSSLWFRAELMYKF